MNPMNPMNFRLAGSLTALCFVMTGVTAAQQPRQQSQQQARPSGPEIVGRQTLVLTKTPERVPSGAVVDGALMGNGDVGVVLGGDPDQLKFYIGKDDFWSLQGSPMTVGGVALKIPALKGASYHAEEDLLHAEVRGSFANADAGLTTRSWVSATENLLVTELQATGKAGLTVEASIFPQGPGIVNNTKHVNLGRAQSGAGGEQIGQGHGYFDGLIDEVHLYDRALTADEVADLAHLKEPMQGLIGRWGFDDKEGTTPADTVPKMVTGPDCAGPPPVNRPDEEPADQPTGCIPNGYHLDYQRYGMGVIGRAAKLMHSWDYVDVGDAPPVKQVSVGAWIYVFAAGDANYIVSKGDWNDAYSLSLDHGRLRFNVGAYFVRSEAALPVQKWVHVAGTFDGVHLRAYIDGKEVEPGARFVENGSTADAVWMTRNADGPLDEQYPWHYPLPPTSTPETKGREVSVAMRLVGAASTVEDGTIHFTLEPGVKVYLVTSILSDLDSPHHEAAVQARVEDMNADAVEKVNAAHRAWWRDYWSQSYVETNDPVLDKYYYSTQYVIASASRSGKVAPGLYGPWITTDHPAWNGDYTLNYNHQTPYLALFSSNHVATADPYDPPVLELMGRSEEYAKTMLHVGGVYYPGHMSPWGMERQFDYDPFMGMKGDAGFLAMPMLMRFYNTYDDNYAAQVYPFLKEVGAFWADFMVKENGRYVIHDDCPNEVGPWLDGPKWNECPYGTNPTNDLAFVRATLKGLIDISTELGVDANERPKWQEILDHLSPYPTGDMDGKRVLLTADGAKGMKMTSTVPFWGLVAIWPANQIGLGLDPELRQIGLNTLSAIGYSDHPLYAPAMARVGYDPEKLLADLKADCLKNAYPNGYLYYYGGGLETTSKVPATIDEMMMQSFSGVLRVFPDWPVKTDASFENLRAYGAFLVSSRLKDGVVENLTIVSEKGRDCTLANPWAGKTVVLYRNGQKAETLKGDTITFKTAVNERIAVQPIG